jgi:cytochrome c
MNQFSVLICKSNFESKKMNVSVIILIIWLITGVPSDLKAQAPAADRPTEMWAFRSVLDGIPRMLTLALHSDLFVGYDTYHCGVTKVWKEGVTKQGAVYNFKHGPQPVSKGGKYLEMPLKESVWFVTGAIGNGVQMKNCNARFQGYRFEKGKIALRYQLKIDSMHDAVLDEWPEYVDGISGPILERYFVWVKPPRDGVQIFTEIFVDGMASTESLKSNSDLKPLTRTEKLTMAKPIWSVLGMLKIKADAPTFVKVLLDPAAIL